MATYSTGFIGPKPSTKYNFTQAPAVRSSTPAPAPAQPSIDRGKLADSYYNELSGSVNSYVDDLMGTAKGQLDLALKRLDTEHKLALGNDDQARAQFLESVADSLEQQIGRIPYDYQRYTDRELKQYAMSTQQISTTKDLALKKLALDEEQTKTGIQNEQRAGNQALTEDLNARGLLYGQTPQGVDQATELQGLGGVAGRAAGTQNKLFGQQYDFLNKGTALGRENVNTTAAQNQGQLDLTHSNTMQDLKVGARRDGQDAQNAFTFGTEDAKKQYDEKQKALERMRDTMLRQARIQSGQLIG